MTAYYRIEDREKLADLSLGAPGLWEQFQSWYGAVFRDGALSSREKALIGLAVANALQCPYCIDVTTRSSLERGASLEQMTEALQVSAALRAGATLSHGVQMREAAERFEAKFAAP